MQKIKNKVVLLGDVYVGKTSIAHRFSKGEFKENVESTSGAVFFTHTIEKDNVKMQFDIWDTAGQERFRALGLLKRCTVLQKRQGRLDCFRSDQPANLSARS